MATIKLEVIAPDKLVFSEDVDMIITRSTGGELGILPHHAPLLTGILPHAMHIKRNNKEELLAVSGGFMEVTPEKINILASAAELPINIDVNRAQKAYDRAKKRLDALHDAPNEHPNIDGARAQAALNRASARLLVKNNN